MAQQLNTTGKIVDQVVKPAITGAMCFAAAKAMGMDGTLTIPVINKEYAAPMALAGFGAVGSVVAEAGHMWILPHIDQSSKLGNMEAMILAPLICGGAVAGGVYFGDKYKFVNGGAAKFFGIGAGAEVASNYAFEAVVQPWLKTKGA